MNTVKNQQGFVLIATILIITIALLLVTAVTMLSRQQISLARTQMAKDVGLYAADAGIQMARLRIANDQTGNFTMTVPHMDLEDGLEVNVTINASGDDFDVVSSTIYLGHDRIIEATVRQDSPSEAFNFAYFIGSWGWWYGDEIYGLGDVHSNGPFTFAGFRPTIKGGDINSSMYIHNNPMGTITQRTRIRQNQGSVRQQGTGGYYNPYTSHIEFPNPRHIFSRLDAQGMIDGTVTIGGDLVISGKTMPDAGAHQNVYLEGTTQNPIEVDGIVFVPGDVIIKGKITGQGTIYAGRNIYFASDTTYLDPPTARNTALGMSGPPATGLVANGVDNDMVVFSAFDHIVWANVMHNNWQTYVMNWVNNPLNESDENVVGRDGIPNTPDDGPYDVSGSGTIDPRPTISDFRFNQTLHGDNYWRLPENVTQNSHYSQITGSGLQTVRYLDGIFHAGRFIVGGLNQAEIFGALASRHEAIFYFNNVEFMHDKRLHTRYHEHLGLQSLNQTLGLQGANTAAGGLVSWNEVR